MPLQSDLLSLYRRVRSNFATFGWFTKGEPAGVYLSQRPMSLTPSLDIKSCTMHSPVAWPCSLTSLCVCTSPLSSLQSWRLLSPKLPCGLCFISSSLQDLLSTSLLCSQLLSTPTKVWLPRCHPYRLRLDHSLECVGFFLFFFFNQ